MYSVYEYSYVDAGYNEYIFTVEYALRPAEKDVGIMSPYIDFEVIQIKDVETGEPVEDLFFTDECINQWLSHNSDIVEEIESYERSEYEYAQEKKAERIAENRALREGEDV